MHCLHVNKTVASCFDKKSSSVAVEKIKSASKEKYGWEVELANGLELKFNAAGKFVGIED